MLKFLKLVTATLMAMLNTQDLFDGMCIFSALNMFSSNKYNDSPDMVWDSQKSYDFTDQSKLKEYENVRSLMICDTDLEGIPRGIENLVNLKTLIFTRNKNASELHGLNRLSSLKKLKHLNLSKNGIEKLPEDINKLKNLKTLDISNNNLNTIERAFSALNKLRSLDISGNNFATIPGVLVLQSDLRILKASNNKICSLEKSFGLLRKLEKLDLSKNNFTEFPEHVLDLKNLKVLEMHNNRISRLSGDWSNLRKLSSLNLEENEICELPESFKQLVSLKSLDLYNNEFLNFPEILYDIPKLKYVWVSSNNIFMPDKGFLKEKEIRRKQNQLESAEDGRREGLKNLIYHAVAGSAAF